MFEALKVADDQHRMLCLKKEMKGSIPCSDV